MANAIADRARGVRAEESQGRTALRIFPIVGPSHAQPPYRLLEGETLSAVKITETSPSGHVPELKVENTLDCLLFLMDGQELVGAKQNRILNTDVLVPAGATLTIPVSCVEAGRWHHVSAHFMPGAAASHTIRSRKVDRVRRAAKESGRFDADQQAVWQEVHFSMSRARAESATAALHDAYTQRQRDLDDFRQSLRMPDEAVGLAVFHGTRFLGLDLFDRHSTLVYFWQSLLDSYAIDWLMAGTGGGEGAPPPEAPPEARAVRDVLERAALGRWESFASPGQGRDHRLDDQQLSGSALVWEDKVVLHLQLFPKVQDQSGSDETARQRPRIRRPYGLPGQGEVVY